MNLNWRNRPETPNLGQIRRFLEPCDLEIWQMTLQNNRAPLPYYFKLCASFRTHWWIPTWVTVRKRPIWVKIDDFFEMCDLRTWHMTLKNKRALIQYNFKLCASFRSHWWIQTGATIRKCPTWVKINDFFSPVTFRLDGWHWKIIEHLVYDTLSFVHHFNAIGKFKLQFKSGNAQSGSKSTSSVT